MDNLNYRIEVILERKLVGKRLTMSFAANRTMELWKSFIPHRNQVVNAVGVDLYSIQIYAADYFAHFSPVTTFEKWAAVQVPDFSCIPEGMETFVLPVGKYAVFHYKGSSREGSSTFQYIFKDWLPASGYELDNRPHFELLGLKYKNDDPNSEEEIWIPIRRGA
ncbi:MAG: GyrI-like domain-containing protein [Chryseolinea sp.]